VDVPVWDQPGADELSAASEDRARVRALLPKLAPRDREVLCRFAGLKGFDPQPVNRIAKDMGVSRQRIGQILERATRELRLHMEG
jgi:RNA polymerase sigma factor (sigma-70 family)